MTPKRVVSSARPLLLSVKLAKSLLRVMVLTFHLSLFPTRNTSPALSLPSTRNLVAQFPPTVLNTATIHLKWGHRYGLCGKNNTFFWWSESPRGGYSWGTASQSPSPSCLTWNWEAHWLWSGAWVCLAQFERMGRVGLDCDNENGPVVWAQGMSVFFFHVLWKPTNIFILFRHLQKWKVVMAVACTVWGFHHSHQCSDDDA